MPLTKKKTPGKHLKKSASSSTVVVKTRIPAKATLFPDKVASAKKILSNTQFL